MGSHVVDELLAAGYRVRCLVRDPRKLRWLEGQPVELVGGDLVSFDPGEALVGIHAVFHFAGLTRGERRDLWAVNHAGTRSLLDACLETGRELAFIYCSSRAAAGPARPGRPRTEDDPPAPISEYGRSKLAGEEELWRGAEGLRGESLRGVVLRPVAVYGPRDRDTLTYFQMARRGFVPVPGVRERRLQVVHARDVARAARLAAERGVAGRTYFIAHPRIVTWSDLVEAIGEAVGRRVWRIPVPGPLLRAIGSAVGSLGAADRPGRIDRRRARDLTVRDWTCRVDRAGEELGWEPRYDLQAGLRETADWYRDRGWL